MVRAEPEGEAEVAARRAGPFPDEDVARPIVDAVERTLQLARTWLAWDGRPLVSEDGDRVYTPHKAIRRMSDHLIDHLAEVEALLAGQPTEAYGWHGSLVTFHADWATFSEADYQEAEQRLRRLARTFALRLSAAGQDSWDAPRGENMSLREIAHHVGTAWYAEQVGDLSARRGG